MQWREKVLIELAYMEMQVERGLVLEIQVIPYLLEELVHIMQERNAYMNLHPLPSQSMQPVTNNLYQMPAQQMQPSTNALNPLPPQQIQPAKPAVPAENIQLIPESTSNKSQAKSSDDITSKQLLDLLTEQKSEISALKTMILNLSNQLIFTNERLNQPVKQEPSMPAPKPSMYAPRPDPNVLVETVENEND